MSPDRDTEQPAAGAVAQEPLSSYEPPRIETLGTVSELTMGTIPSGADISVFGSVSDRRLKTNVAPVDARDVLAGVVSLAAHE